MQFETATLIKLLAALMAFMLKIRWGCKKLINKAAVIDEWSKRNKAIKTDKYWIQEREGRK